MVHLGMAFLWGFIFLWEKLFHGNSKIIEKYIFDCNIKPIIENMEKW